MNGIPRISDWFQLPYKTRNAFISNWLWNIVIIYYNKSSIRRLRNITHPWVMWLQPVVLNFGFIKVTLCEIKVHFRLLNMANSSLLELRISIRVFFISFFSRWIGNLLILLLAGLEPYNYQWPFKNADHYFIAICTLNFKVTNYLVVF